MDIRERQKLREKKRRRKRLIVLAIFLAVVAGVTALCFALSGKKTEPSPVEPTPTPQAESTAAPEVQEETDPNNTAAFVAAMSLDEKLMQLLVVSADGLTGVENSTLYGGKTQKAITDKPVGGIVYSAGNIENTQQLASLISNTQKQYTEENSFPVFIIAEEEGGERSPIADKLGGDVGNMSQFADGENYDDAKTAGASVGKYMKRLGFNMNLAPLVEVDSGPRYFGTDIETVTSMAMAFGEGLKENGIIPVYKSFPGKVTSATAEALRENELLPFRLAANNNASIIMVSSKAASVLTGGNDPCYASTIAVSDTLKTELGFGGLVITDALQSDADAVAAIKAGCDMLLMPKDTAQVVESLKKAVESGEITEERINSSVEKIISLKLSM